VNRWTINTGAREVMALHRNQPRPMSPEALGLAVKSDGSLWQGQPPAGRTSFVGPLDALTSRALCAAGLRCIKPLAPSRNETNSSWFNAGADEIWDIPRICAYGSPVSQFSNHNQIDPSSKFTGSNSTMHIPHDAEGHLLSLRSPLDGLPVKQGGAGATSAPANPCPGRTRWRGVPAYGM
jgi:hypothetical protein